MEVDSQAACVPYSCPRILLEQAQSFQTKLAAAVRTIASSSEKGLAGSVPIKGSPRPQVTAKMG